MSSQQQIRPSWDAIFASFGDGLVILDTSLNVIGMNPAAESITGFSAESTLGLKVMEAFPNNEAVFERLTPALQEGNALTLREVPWVGHQRVDATVDVSVTPLIDDEGGHSGWILVFRDVTPVKKLQEEMRKADRLAMMGTVAAGLAHEIKNPLSGIKGAAQLLGREFSSEEAAECLQIIVKESDRVDRLVNQLLTFSRPKDLALSPVNLNELLDGILILHKESFAKNRIQVIVEFDPSLPPVLGSADELKQVFLNLMTNAAEAVKERHPKEGGSIRLKTRMASNFKRKGLERRKPTRMIEAEIQDNGVGIRQEDQSNIFTPFFTKKETGHGLGLAVSQRIVHEHGGAIYFVSREGEGTTFQVLLRSSL